MKLVFSLLLAAFIAHILPTSLSLITNSSKTAWEYVCYGIEASFLWALLGIVLSNSAYIKKPKYKIIINFFCLFGFFESIQRPVCRLAFPMNIPPVLLPGQNLCDAATGLPLSFLGLVFALFLCCLIQDLQTSRNLHD
jgi:hypothetical protein